jgi:glucose-1-phosphate thymidylyltransferase
VHFETFTVTKKTTFEKRCEMKGIVLAGGGGSRLYPLTKTVSKQLLPVYDKPTIYYPLSILMLMGLKEILIISTPRDLPLIKGLLGTGDDLGIKFSFEEQAAPNGIAEAFIIGEEFLAGEGACLILGDNLFYGQELPKQLEAASHRERGATVFAYHVQDPERYGVIEFGANGQALTIEEKPKIPKSNWAVTGLYVYDDQVCKMAKSLKPSKRGELEITDLNRMYLEKNELHVQCLGRGTAWLDTGTHDSLLTSSQFVQTIEHRQGLKIGCLEEIAYLKGFIDLKQLTRLAEEAPSSTYGLYLKNMIKHPELFRK